MCLDTSTMGLESRIDRSSKEHAHHQVRSRLLRLLDGGTLRPGDKLPPEPEIAERLGVSRMTANKAILNLVAEGRLVRAKGRGTFVSEIAGLAQCAIAVYGDPTYALQDYYFGALYWGIHARLAAADVPTLLTRPVWSAAALGPRDAIVAINPGVGDMAELGALARQGVRVVGLGVSWPAEDVPTVDSDNRLGAKLAVDHLASLGHRRIAFLGARPDTSNTRDRLWGFRDAVAARGLFSEGEILEPEALGLGEANEARLLDLVEGGMTAVFAAGPRLALGLLAIAQRAGVRVPEDISIVGYDDADFLALAHPAITTVRQPLAEMASRAADLLLLPNLDSTSRDLIEPQIVFRGSSAPPSLTP